MSPLITTVYYNFSIFQNYKQTWKAAHNHFSRYSDIKPKEDRRPSVMDLANQAHIVQKIEGWKIHRITDQMQDLVSILQ